jgi:hypothetical protein
MKRYWYKTYVEDVFSKTRMQLPDWLHRRLTEFEAFAADFGEDGLLPPVADMAWILRPVDETKLSEALLALSRVGEVEQTPEGGWRLTRFEARQMRVPEAERTRQSRLRKSSVTTRNNSLQGRDGNSNDDVTHRDSAVADDVTSPLSSSSESSSVLSDSEEGGGGGEGNWIPETPAQAKEHPDIRAFQAICGRIPGARDYELVISTIRLLRAQHGAKLTETLQPFWLAWSGRKSKSGRPYDPASLVWLTEWAVNGTIPQANGKEPSRADDRGKYVEGSYAEFVEH